MLLPVGSVALARRGTAKRALAIGLLVAVATAALVACVDAGGAGTPDAAADRGAEASSDSESDSSVDSTMDAAADVAPDIPSGDDAVSSAPDSSVDSAIDAPANTVPDISSCVEGWIRHGAPLDGEFDGVWGSGPSDVWVVGFGGTSSAGAMEHWNGRAWARVSLPSDGGITDGLNGVWGSGPRDVWAVGNNGTIVHWNGTAWSGSMAATPFSFRGVWGTGPGDVWVVGRGAGGSAIQHWSGNAWSVSGDGSGTPLQAVWGSAPNDVWAVGDNGEILHWDGNQWSHSVVGNDGGTTYNLLGVWGSGSSDVWAVGSQGVVRHWNGSAWAGVPLPSDGGIADDLTGVWGSGPSDVWAVGSKGTIMHWDGGGWAVSASLPRARLLGVAGSGPNDVWAVGGSQNCPAATVLQWNGGPCDAADGGVPTGVSIAMGAHHTCAVLSDHTVQCWGSNDHGQLGDGTTTSSSAPVKVAGLSEVLAIAAGSSHTCAMLFDRSVWCWGDNSYGQIGLARTGSGDGASSSVPVALCPGGYATSISASEWHTYVTSADGAVLWWGDNGGTPSTFQLGEVYTASAATAVVAGHTQNCALVSGGAVQCWSDPRGVSSVLGLNGATAISIGYDHVCAVLAGGTVKCWGSNAYAQLGDGTKTDSSVPVAVAGVAGATAVAAGYRATCALLSSGAVSCWGDDTFGQLGSASADGGIPSLGGGLQGFAPQAVQSLTNARAISSGFTYLDPSTVFQCALLADGAVECWGSNAFGQRGDGTSLSSPTPGPVTCHGGECSGLCSPSCASCSASCSTPACCGSSCQTAHANAFGQPFYDCSPLGTINRTQALEACGASSDQTCSDKTCTDDGGATSYVCNCTRTGLVDGGVIFWCWAYAGPNAGQAYQVTGGSCSACPSGAGQAWN